MIDYLEIEGFKSIGHMQLELKPINILIGGNGSGKSNFISFFRLIGAIFGSRLQKFVIEENAESLLHYGRKQTEMIKGKIIFTDGSYNNAYRFGLAQTKEGGLYIDFEGSGYNVDIQDNGNNYFYEHNLKESVYAQGGHLRHHYLKEYVANVQAFHFHDTSATSLLRRSCDVDDNLYFKQDGRNLPAYLYLLKVKHPKVYNRILKTIQAVAPYIADFILEPSRLNEKEIELRWIDSGDPQSNFSAYQLSDGTLRFIALATLLKQPAPPKVIIIDEPELGLHPFAISELAGMLQAASSKAQIIVATQSPRLISNFHPQDIIIIDRNEAEKQTVFGRLDPVYLKAWLAKFDLGILWENNIINAAQPFSK